MDVRHGLLLLAALTGTLSGCASGPCATGACGVPQPVVTDCAECQGSGCGSCLHAVKQHLHDSLTCGSGCGDIVLGEWLDNPPACDPCNNCGQWTGNAACPPKPYHWGHVLGVRSPECTHCGHFGHDGLILASSKGGSLQKGVPTTYEAPPAETIIVPAAELQATAVAPQRRRMLFE